MQAKARKDFPEQRPLNSIIRALQIQKTAKQRLLASTKSIHTMHQHKQGVQGRQLRAEAKLCVRAQAVKLSEADYASIQDARIDPHERISHRNGAVVGRLGRIPSFVDRRLL